MSRWAAWAAMVALIAQSAPGCTEEADPPPRPDAEPAPAADPEPVPAPDPEPVPALDPDPDPAPEPEPEPEPAPAPEAVDVPDDAVPCDHPEGWPLQVASDRRPLVVRYQAPADADTARQVLALLEQAWDVEVDGLGFSPPLPDGGLCGDTDDFDVFLWRDHVESAVDILAENPDTAWDDAFSYMILDPWGPYGGDALDVTVAHEFNHACQAADDWYDSAFIFEATATFIEEVVHPDDDGWWEQAQDFESRPQWSLDRDDGYETWFMYGAAHYLHFLRAERFGGDAGFVARMWKAMRQPRFRSEDEWENEPDFADALDALLAPDSSFLKTLPDFAAWRWRPLDADPSWLGSQAGLDVPGPGDAAAIHALRPAPMLLGTAYIDLMRPPPEDGAGAAGMTARLADHDHPGVTWVLQALPDGPRSDDGAPLTLPPTAQALAITALPSAAFGPYDPDDRDDRTYPATLVLERTPEP